MWWHWSGRAGNAFPVGGDFDGDGAGDIFYYGPGSKQLDEVIYGPGQPVEGEEPAPAERFDSNVQDGFATPVPGDFNGDGRDDLFWYGNGTGADEVWLSTTTRGEFTVAASSIEQDGVDLALTSGDYDDDGLDDLFWFDESGDEVVWYSDGANEWSVVTPNVQEDGIVTFAG